MLKDDAAVSPLTRGTQECNAALCTHHAALYHGLRRSQACAKDGCNTIGAARKDGIMLRRDHIDERAEGQRRAARSGTNRRPIRRQLGSLLRQARRQQGQGSSSRSNNRQQGPMTRKLY